jgi:hypothetical protein
MFLASCIALFALVLLLVFWVRPSDLPASPPPNPAAYLEERKAAIYENLRDLTFEFRLGKLSDSDYEKSKLGLQEELARVMAEIDALTGAALAAEPVRIKIDPLVCPHCRARFDKPMKFCGECGKSMDLGLAPEAHA